MHACCSSTSQEGCEERSQASRIVPKGAWDDLPWESLHEKGSIACQTGQDQRHDAWFRVLVLPSQSRPRATGNHAPPTPAVPCWSEHARLPFPWHVLPYFGTEVSVC